MSNSWKETTLGEVAIINPSESLKAGKVAKYVAMENLTPFTRDINRYEKREFKGGSKFRNGDVLVARITPCLENGKTALVNILEENEVAFGSTEYIVIREKNNISDKKYLYYFTTSPNFRDAAIKSMTGTSGRQRVQTDLIADKLFLFPPLSEQKAIAAVLSSFDDKIELLRRQNKTLESIAQTIFKEWFVKFKVNGKKLKIDSKTNLPEGWRMGKYGELADVTTGKGLKKEFIKEKGMYSVLGANGELGQTDDYLFDENLILTGRVGTLGAVYISRGKAWISDNVLISKPLHTRNFYFAYFNLKQLNFDSLNRGSTQPLITQTDLKNVEVIMPIQEILDTWDNVVSQLFEKIYNNSGQIQTLSKLRDTLLPKLMKGEIRVRSEKGKVKSEK